MIELKINGVGQHVEDYSVQCDVVSLNPADTSAGIGGVSARIPDSDDDIAWRFNFGKSFALTHGNGSQQGYVTSIAQTDFHKLDIAAESSLRALQGDNLVKPFKGTLQNCVRHIVNSVLPLATVSFGVGMANPNDVVVPAHYGSVWVFLRDFLAVYRLELVLTPTGGLLVREMLSNPSTIKRDATQPFPASVSATVEGNQSCEQVEIEYYGNEYVTNGTAYPVIDEEPSVISVNEAEVVEVELTTKTGLSLVNQPVPVDWLGAEYSGEGTMGSYTIAGDDGLPVKASSWTAAGGSVSVRIKEDDPYTLILTLTAPTKGVLATTTTNVNTAAPYHLAMTDGELYPRLFITGTGVRTTQNSLIIDTGANSDITTKGVGYTLSNPCVGTLSQAYDAGIRVAQAFAGVGMAVTRSAHRAEDTDFTKIQGSKYEDKAINFRIESVSYGPSDVSFTAKPSTTFSDFNALWAGKKFSAFNTGWAGFTFQENTVAPLRDLND